MQTIPLLSSTTLQTSREAHVAVIGAGMAGAACAMGLVSAGAAVTVFERSPRMGGRVASRFAGWTDDAGVPHATTFSHGTSCFSALRPRFRNFMGRAVDNGQAARWVPKIHAARSASCDLSFVTLPSAPGFFEHMFHGSTLRLGCDVRRLQRADNGTWFVAAADEPLEGPFSHVVLAVTPSHAAVLLAGHSDAWASSAMSRRMEPCWTLMAVTDEVDWPWDAAEPDRGPLRWVARNDRIPGRSAPAGLAVWVAHATAEWSASRLDSEPESVRDEMQAALRAQLPATGIGGDAWRWHHAAVQRWSHAAPALGCDSFDSGDAWWDDALGLGVCGDWMAGAGLEAAWQSGDELADLVSASLERPSAAQPEATWQRTESSNLSSVDDHLVTG